MELQIQDYLKKSTEKIFGLNQDEDQVNDKQLLNARMQKLKCILTYFIKARQKIQRQQIQRQKFQRQNVQMQNTDSFLTFLRIKMQLPKTKKMYEINKNKQIFDFFNKKNIIMRDNVQIVYGNVIQNQGKGIVLSYVDSSIGKRVFSNDLSENQEQIFYSHPQLMVLKVIAQDLQDNQALIVSGVERVCECGGQDDNFLYIRAIKSDENNGSNDNARTNMKIKTNTNNSLLPQSNKCVFGFINSLNFLHLQQDVQFRTTSIYRQLMRIYCLFQKCENDLIISGEWMCQCFGIDKQLNFLLQWIALSGCQGKRLRVIINHSEQQQESKKKVKSNTNGDSVNNKSINQQSIMMNKKKRIYQKVVRRLKQSKLSTIIAIIQKYYTNRFNLKMDITLFQYINRFLL